MSEDELKEVTGGSTSYVPIKEYEHHRELFSSLGPMPGEHTDFDNHHNIITKDDSGFG